MQCDLITLYNYPVKSFLTIQNDVLNICVLQEFHPVSVTFIYPAIDKSVIIHIIHYTSQIIY